MLCFAPNGNVGIGNNNSSHKLTVNGNTLLNGPLHIIEGSGTTTGANSGSKIIDHDNNGGASSITFRSRANKGSDFGYIQYQDASSVGAGGESARLIIGTSNDGDDHLILAPSGNVGIGIYDPSQKLTVQGNINSSGNIYAASGIFASSLTAYSGITASSLQVNGSVNANNLTASTINGNTINVNGINISRNGQVVFGGGGCGKMWCGDTNHGIFIYQNTATPTNGNPGDELEIRSYGNGKNTWCKWCIS